MSAGCVKRHEPLTWAALSHLTTNLWLTLGKATCVHRIDVQGLHLHCQTCKTCKVVVVDTTIHDTASSLRGKSFHAVSGKERGTIFREPKTKTLATQAVQQELFTIADLSQENQRSTRYSLFSHQVCQDLEKLSQ